MLVPSWPGFCYSPPVPDLLVRPAKGALLLAGIASGKSRIKGGALGEDNAATLSALRAMGISVAEPSEGELILEGAGLHGLRAPVAPIDCGNSGTTMRILTGVLAAQRFASRLI